MSKFTGKTVQMIDLGLDPATQEYVTEICVRRFSRVPFDTTLEERWRVDCMAAKEIAVDLETELRE